MKTFLLPFGKIILLESNIAEIIINDGVVLDESMVIKYRNIMQAQLKTPFSILINKENGYSYTFDAQLIMGQLNDDVAFRAVVVYSQSAEMATQIIMNINKNNNWKIKIFRERKLAIDWLLQNQNNKSAM